MKQLLILTLSVLFLFSCAKTSNNNPKPEDKPSDDSTYLLTKVTLNESPILVISYHDNLLSEAENSYYKDIFWCKSNGQIDSVTTYWKATFEVIRIKKVHYGSNNKIERIEEFANGSLLETTIYTYDAGNRVKMITISDSGTKSVYSYTLNAQGNQTIVEHTYSIAGKVEFVDKVTTSSFDVKANPFIAIKDYEYFFSDKYQREYKRLGIPANLSKNNPVQSQGQFIYNGKTESGAITYGWEYNVTSYPVKSQYSNLVRGSLMGDYAFEYIKKD